jgi:hypothetical protein
MPSGPLMTSSSEHSPAQYRQNVESPLSVNNIDGDHHTILIRAINRILLTDIAEMTYAQILDGLPLASVADDSAQGTPPDHHPIRDHHEELCPGVLEKIRDFRKNFNPDILEFDSTVRA